MSDDRDWISEGIENAWLEEQNQRALESRDQVSEQGPPEPDEHHQDPKEEDEQKGGNL